MAYPPEFWLFIASNILLFITGMGMTGLSLLAHHRSGRNSYRIVTLGFAVITFGTLIEMIYEVGIRGSYHITGQELLLLHTVEGVFIAGGLGLLFYAIIRH